MVGVPRQRTGDIEQANAGGVNVAVTGAVGSVTIGRSRYVIEGVPSTPTTSWQNLPPSELLAARRQVVPFTGRDTELTALAGWRDDDARGWAVRLVHGPGGQGKTRFANEFGARSAAVGWAVVQARHESSAGPVVPGAGVPQHARGLLLVVDYAERWPVGHLLAVLTEAAVRPAPDRPVRVLLLARPAGLWWQGLRSELGKLDIVASNTALPGLADTAEVRLSVFTAARDRFADLRGVAGEGVGSPVGLADPVFGRVLAVHMAALVAVDAAARGAEPAGDVVGLSSYLLDREQQHWRVMYEHGRISTGPKMLGRVVFTATLTRPVVDEIAGAALARVTLASSAEAARAMVDDHGECYPATDRRLVFTPLFPDRLGEDFLALTIPGHDLDQYTPDPWAAGAAARLLSPAAADEEPPEYAGGAVAVLVETAARWPHVAQALLHPLLRAHPGLAVAAGPAALARLIDIPDIDATILEAVEAHLPRRRRVGLDLVAAALTERLAQRRLAETDDPATRAGLHAKLGYRRANAGHGQAALAATTEAIDLYRRLAGTDPAAFEPDLAKALNNVSLDLSDLGRHEQALAAAAEAVDIRRRLAATGPATFESDLATSLNNLSVCLSRLGRSPDALATTTEAVRVYRRLADADPAYASDLAIALNNLAVYLSNLGQRDDALAAGAEAVDIRRRLTGADPAAFEPDLAIALNNHSAFLSKVGRSVEALAATTEAVHLYRRLVATGPAAYETHLASALNNLGIRLSNVGRLAEALTATTEAVDLYRRLVATDPAAHEPNLSTALNNLGNRLSDHDRWDDALAAATEAVDIRRRLAAVSPAAYESDLAAALNNLGNRLSKVGRPAEALAATAEAVHLHRGLAATDPAAYESDLANSLWCFARVREVGNLDLTDALDAGREAVERYSRLFTRWPDAFAAEHRTATNTLADLRRRVEGPAG